MIQRPLVADPVMPAKKFLLLLALLGVLAGRCAAEKIDLGGGKAVLVTVPLSWSEREAPVAPGDVPAIGRTVRYVPKNGSNDAVLITFIPVPDDRFQDRANLRAMVEQATEQFVASSVEGKADLKDLPLAGATGFAATFTDAELVGKPAVKGNYKALTACFAYLGNHVVLTATVFTDDPHGRAYAEGMRLVKSLALPQPKDAL
jgi:hypothetical protein